MQQPQIETDQARELIRGHNFKTLKALERDHILAVVEHYKGNLKQARDVLGTSRATLYRKLKEYRVGRPVGKRR